MAAVGYATWGLLAPVGKILLEDMAPMTLNAWRSALGLLLVAALVGPAAIREGTRYLRDWRLTGLILVGGGVNFTFYNIALERIDATFVAMGFYTAPLWTAAVAYFWIGERVGRLFLPAVAVMFAGGYFALGGIGGPEGGAIDALGLVLAVGTGLFWAVYAVGLRVHAPHLRLRPLLWASFLVWTLYFIVVAVAVDGPRPPNLDAPAWGWLLLYVVGPTVGTMFLFNAALQRAPAGDVNVLVGLEVAFTVLFAFLLLGDRFTWLQMVGVATVLLAVTVYLRRHEEEIDPGTAGRAASLIVKDR